MWKHNLTFCLHKFLLVLKNRECAESGLTKLVIKQSKGLRIKSPVVWTSLGPLPRWVPGPTTRWAPGTTWLVPHGT
jgi:hypothetical protein